jgi:hypothetical protein
MSISTTRHAIVLGESNCGKVRALKFKLDRFLNFLQSEFVRKLCGLPFLHESSPTLGIASQVHRMRLRQADPHFFYISPDYLLGMRCQD